MGNTTPITGINMSDDTHTSHKQNHQRHPDLEIYIKDCNSEQILAWLNLHCESIEILSSSQTSLELEIQFGDQYTNSSLVHKVSGKAWSSLWLKTNVTAWDTDLEIAQQASREMDKQIRCIKASWADGDTQSEDDHQWWKIEDNQQQLISWKG